MKTKAVFSILLTLLLCSTALAQPQVDNTEVLRRGDMVVHVDGTMSEQEAVWSQVFGPPEDDSHKWFITVVSTNGCKYCDKLIADFKTSPKLRPWADPANPKQSWAHYNVYNYNDETQSWRWKNIKVSGFPTILIQPPRDGSYGKPSNIVLQATGYDGPEKLDKKIREAILKYVSIKPAVNASIVAQQDEDEKKEQEAGGSRPPFTPAPLPDPNPAPLDFPPPFQPAPEVEPPVGMTTFWLTSILAGLFGSSFLHLLTYGLKAYRKYRESTGQKPLLDQESFQRLIDLLEGLANNQEKKE